jgi:hypothetical protein
VVEGVDARLPAVEVWWWDPFGVAVCVFAGGPALFGEFVVGAAGQGEVVDVGDGVDGVGVAVVGFAEVSGHGAARGALRGFNGGNRPASMALTAPYADIRPVLHTVVAIRKVRVNG